MVIVKSEEQIAGIRKSCYLAADTLRSIEAEVKAGQTTEQINRVAEDYIRDHGAIPAPLNYQGFPKATCISLNEVVCHGIPGETILQDGDIVKIDVTTILDGYYGDTCATFAVGQISERASKLMSVCRDCLAIGIAQIRPGNEFGRSLMPSQAMLSNEVAQSSMLSAATAPASNFTKSLPSAIITIHVIAIHLRWCPAISSQSSL
jgi:methionyl aminopeptidase